MRTRPLIVIAALLATLLFAHQALAFTMDDKSGTKPDGSARYVDPDDQPSPFLFGTPQGQAEGNDRSLAPRYNGPAAGGGSPWLQLPDWFTSTPRPPRK
jgi:hypothetical protein